MTYQPRETENCHPKQHSAHVYAFYNAPASQKRMATLLTIASLEAELKSDNRISADAYYGTKQLIRELRANLVGKRSWQTDPMGYHFDMQSN